MLVGKSKTELILVRALLIYLQYLGLLCLAYFFVVLALAGLNGIKHPVSIFIEALGLVEILFYLVWYLPYSARLQRRGPRTDSLTRPQRRIFYKKCLDNVPDIEEYIRGWHGKAQLGDIRRENVKDWLLWALFDRDGRPGHDDAELEEYITDAEERLGIKIRPGFGDAWPLRLSVDPVVTEHRSLTFYVAVGAMDWITTLFFLVRGFRFYRQPRSSFFSLFPLRPITLLSPHASASPALSYFYRPHRSKTQRPILFLHGVGVGLIPYVPWLNSIPSDVGVLAVEILPISSRICPPLPATTELVEGIRAILEQQQMDDFVLVGHSFGTLLVSPMLRDDRVSARIDSVVLIDPVSLLLHLPQVAYNFTRRKPKYGNEWEIHFAATDPGIAHTLARRFWWHDYILWADQLRGRRTTVILGAEDCVTNPDAVASYVYFGDLNFTRNDALEWRTTIERWSGQGELELLYLEGRDHGQVFLSAGGLPQISNVVMGYTQRSKELGGRSSANLPARESV